MARVTSDERREAILFGALELVAQGGSQHVTMASLATKTGISRPAIYQYFASREHVLAEMLIDDIADLSNSIDRLLGQEPSPINQIRLWVHFAMTHLSSAEHRTTRRISVDEIPDDLRGVLKAMHAHFMTSLVDPLSELHIDDPVSFAHFIFAAVSAAAERVDAGAEFTVEARALEVFIGRAISSTTTDVV
jgi:AcrR family transcriptional regulator